VPASLQLALPTQHIQERHSRFIAADIDAVWAALASVRMDQLSVTRPLVTLRHLGRPVPFRGPILTGGPVTPFELDPTSYAVGGAIGRPWQLRPRHGEVATMADFEAFDGPGWAKYLTDFRLTGEPGGTRLITETRGYATDARSRRLPRGYWVVIRLGSGLIRRDILATVDRLATSRTEEGTSHGGS
jgi:hypothetical protein